jgi:hypothetical protein
MNATTTTSTDSTTATVVELQQALSLINLEDKLTMKILAEKINEIVVHLQSSTATTTTRDRGPKSENDMTEDDARRIQLGDLKDISHKDAALQLGLSYGQIYSARKGFTFKNVYKEVRDAAKATAE